MVGIFHLFLRSIRFHPRSDISVEINDTASAFCLLLDISLDNKSRKILIFFILVIISLNSVLFSLFYFSFGKIIPFLILILNFCFRRKFGFLSKFYTSY